MGIENWTEQLRTDKDSARNPKDSLPAGKGKVYDFRLRC